MTPLGERLAWIVATLCAAIGAFGDRLRAPGQPRATTHSYYAQPQPARPVPPLPIPLWNRFLAHVERVARRFQALHAAWQAGTLQPPRPRTSTPRPKTPDAPATPSPRPPRFPRAKGWVLKRAHEAAQAAGMLHMMLQEAPDIRAFATEVPRAARLLRPLCVALAVEQPGWLQLPPRPRAPRTPRPAKPRRWKLTDPELKLRPYEIAAARYFIKKYGRDG